MKKLRLLLSFIFVLFLALSPSAQKTSAPNTANTNTTILIDIGCEGANCAGLTVDATAGGVALTSASYNPSVADQPAAFSQAQMADCYNTGAKIWVTDNSAITLASGRGKAIQDGGYFQVYGFTNISKFKAIRDAAVSSTLYCNYYRQP